MIFTKKMRGPLKTTAAESIELAAKFHDRAFVEATAKCGGRIYGRPDLYRIKRLWEKMAAVLNLNMFEVSGCVHRKAN